MIDQAVTEMEPLVGTAPACRALGASRASLYRRRTPPGQAPRRPHPAPALSGAEREAVLAELHSERFVDASPAQVWATLLDEGRYLASERTMYRILAGEDGGVTERRDQLTHPAYERPELLAQRPTRSTAGTSRSSRARRSGPTSTSTPCSTCSAAIASGGPSSTSRPAWPRR
jgi:putative transposase